MLTITGNLEHTSGPMGTVDYVVVHATVSPCKTGGAKANARYFQSAEAGGLAHYVVDPGEIVATCPENLACWHCPPLNRRGIGVELCDPQAGKDSRWLDAAHQKMLHLAAALFADLCARYRVPMVYVDHESLLRGERGITTHHDAVLAWHKSTHTDPGPGFPMGQFIGLVNAARSKPEPAPTGGDDPPMTDAEIEKVSDLAAQKAAALIRKDLAVLLHGTRDGTHPANLDNLYADTQALRKKAGA